MKPDAVFALGTYQAGSLANFQESYDPTWGRFKNIYPILGDHEYGSPGAEGYFAYFGSRATPQDPDCTPIAGLTTASTWAPGTSSP